MLLTDSKDEPLRYLDWDGELITAIATLGEASDQGDEKYRFCMRSDLKLLLAYAPIALMQDISPYEYSGLAGHALAQREPILDLEVAHYKLNQQESGWILDDGLLFIETSELSKPQVKAILQTCRHLQPIAC